MKRGLLTAMLPLFASAVAATSVACASYTLNREKAVVIRTPAHNERSYDWPATGVYQDGYSNCLGAASVTMLEAYGKHVEQNAYGKLLYKPGWSIQSNDHLLNGFLRSGGYQMFAVAALDSSDLRVLLKSHHRPLLMSVYVERMNYNHNPLWTGGHEIVIVRLLKHDQVLVWDPAAGYQRSTVANISWAAYEYEIPENV